MQKLSPRFNLGQALTWADNEMDAETISGFGQVLWQITPDLELGLYVALRHGSKMVYGVRDDFRQTDGKCREKFP